ncbi:MAG: epoxyqueuosine reductase QueH, partial [Candidatus Omnitrophica bacterium]|nr:epoxyqueuosine reductase QueH [Candidatus Omnitrophota bacterium]
NPNIYPPEEYQKRRMGVVALSGADKIEVIFPEYIPSEFLSAVGEEKTRPKRCLLCWSLRLARTAQFAKENKFYGFSTTLLVSPYQDQEAIKKIGREISEKEGIFFHDEDFRPGFKKAHEQARAKGIYCQNYCGCMYSISR